MGDAPGPVGLIGLGSMGLPVAERLVDAGFDVGLTGRHPDKATALVDAGAVWHDIPRDLARACDGGAIVFLVPDLPQVEAALDGPDGILAASPRDLVLVVSSTASPDGVRALHRRLADDTDGAVRVVDAPVSGGTEGAAAGTLSIMVGGADADVARVRPVLAPCGNPVHLGAVGAGQVAKACNQMIVAATVLALGEAAVLAERSGLDLPVLFDLLAGGYAGSRLLDTRKDRLVAADYHPGGAARYLVKDLDFATAVAAATGTHPVLLPALRAAFAELTDAGLGDLDMAVTRRFVEERDGSG